MNFIKWGKNHSLLIIFFLALENLNPRRAKRNSILERLKTSLEIQVVFQILLTIFLSWNWLLLVVLLPETVKSIRDMILKYPCMGICKYNIMFNAIKAFSRAASLAFSWMVIKFFLFVNVFFKWLFSWQLEGLFHRVTTSILRLCNVEGMLLCLHVK